MLTTNGKTDITPLEAGYDECRIDTLHKHFEKLMNNKKIQCASYCVARNGKTFMSGAVGRIEYDNYEKPLLSDSPIRIASITKLFTTVAIMKLIEDGLLRLDTPIKEIIPEFNCDDFWRITVYHLLTHTSGMLPDQGYNDCDKNYWNALDDYFNNYNSENDGELNWLQAVVKAGMRKKPDEEWMYCTFGFSIMGEIITRLSGVHCHKYIEDEIFKPLGMNDTMFEITPELAKRYIVKDDQKRKYLNDIINGISQEKDKMEEYWDKIPQTGANAKSTPVDLVKFGNMCINKGRLGDVRIVGRKIFERFTTRALYNKPNFAWNTNDLDRAFGIGFDMKRNCEYLYSEGSFFHEGAGACALIMDPVEKMVAAFFVPFDEVPDGWCPEAVYNTQIIIWSGLM